MLCISLRGPGDAAVIRTGVSSRSLSCCKSPFVNTLWLPASAMALMVAPASMSCSPCACRRSEVSSINRGDVRAGEGPLEFLVDLGDSKASALAGDKWRFGVGRGDVAVLWAGVTFALRGNLVMCIRGGRVSSSKVCPLWQVSTRPQRDNSMLKIGRSNLLACSDHFRTVQHHLHREMLVICSCNRRGRRTRSPRTTGTAFAF